MKTERFDGSIERKILTSLIMDRHFLGRVVSKWDKEMFQSDWSNLVAGWCKDYYVKYSKAPRSNIQSIFESWAEEGEKETVKLIDRFLSTLSNEYERKKEDANTDYVLDIANKYLNEVRVKKLRDQLEGDLDSGELEKALKRIDKFGRVEIGLGSGIDVFQDQSAIQQAFEQSMEVLIDYPDALGNFFKGQLTRDALIAVMAPEKRGKTSWLVDITWRGIEQDRKVAFFEVGDMSQSQILRRFAIRAARRPLDAGVIKLPKSIEHNPDDPFSDIPVYLEKKYEDPLSWEKAWKSMSKVMEGKRTQDSMMKLSVHPNSSISVLGVKDVLQSWERAGWVPDVIVLDYADILAPLHGFNETRDQINATWKGLRSLSQSLHCLVVTGTQSDAASYKVETIDRSNFSEDKRKLAHATGIFALNQTPEEKEKGITRVNWVVLREAYFNELKCCHVGGNLAIANPAIVSTF